MTTKKHFVIYGLILPSILLITGFFSYHSGYDSAQKYKYENTLFAKAKEAIIITENLTEIDNGNDRITACNLSRIARSSIEDIRICRANKNCISLVDDEFSDARFNSAIRYVDSFEKNQKSCQELIRKESSRKAD